MHALGLGFLLSLYVSNSRCLLKSYRPSLQRHNGTTSLSLSLCLDFGLFVNDDKEIQMCIKFLVILICRFDLIFPFFFSLIFICICGIRTRSGFVFQICLMFINLNFVVLKYFCPFPKLKNWCLVLSQFLIRYDHFHCIIGFQINGFYI